jgi:hypothetical protein
MQREKLASGAEQAAEKVKSSEKNCEIHPSAAKAGVNPIDLSARVNSCPFKTALGTSFSAACITPGGCVLSGRRPQMLLKLGFPARQQDNL